LMEEMGISSAYRELDGRRLMNIRQERLARAM